MRTEDLSQLYVDPGPFASAYVEVSRDQTDGDRTAELAVREAIDRLSDQGAPEAVCATVEERLNRPTGQPAPISRCVVASEREVLLDQLSRHHRAEPVAHWGRLPEITDWLANASAGVGFVLALVDHQGADVATYPAEGMEVATDASVGEPSKYEQKVKGGGWSHLNWQRSAETVWRRNADEAAAEIERQARASRPELVIIAGDERSRGLVVDGLPVGLGADLIVLDRAGRPVDGGDDALAADVEAVLRERVVARRLAQLHELSERVGQGRAAAVGLDQVADAFVRGQVAHLLIDRDQLPGLELVTSAHPGFQLGAIDAAGTLPAGQALVAAAVLTGAEIDFAGSGGLAGAPVAALLRWDQAPTEGEE